MVAKNPVRSAVEGIKGALDRHQRRASPSGLQAVIGDRIGFLNPAHWDALTEGASFFMSRAYRELLETHAPEGMQQRYALVYRGARPIVALAAQVLDVGATQLANLPDSRLRKKALAGVSARLLVCGSLVSSGFHGLAFAEDEDPQAGQGGVGHRPHAAPCIPGRQPVVWPRAGRRAWCEKAPRDGPEAVPGRPQGDPGAVARGPACS